MPKMRVFLILLVAMAALAPAALGQQDSTGAGWAAWLFNFNSNTVLKVDLDGLAETFAIPLPEGAFLYSTPALSHDGARLAFCQTDGAGSVTVRVHEIASGAELLSYPVGEGMGCSVGPAAFDEANAMLAVGILNDHPGRPPADPQKPAWELIVMEVGTGEIAHRLDSDTPGLADLELQADLSQFAFMPMVWDFSSGEIALGLVPWGTEGPPKFDGLRWRLDDGTLETVDRYGRWAVDALDETGEAIWLDIDESLPVGAPLPALGATYNVLMYLRDGAEAQIFTEPMALVNARFIDDGRRIAIQEVGAFDEQTGTAPTQWVILDRTGAVEALPPDLTDHNLVNAPAGFAILHTQYRGENYTDPLTELRYYRIQESAGDVALEGTVLWDDPTTAWTVLQASAVQVTETLAPFPPITR